MERVNLPYEFQRRRDLIRLYLELTHKELLKRIKDRARLAFEVRIIRIISLIRGVIYETIKRENEALFYIVSTKQYKDTEKRIILDKKTSEFIKNVEKILPELENLIKTGKSEFGFDDSDVKEVEEIKAFISKLKTLGYIEL